MYNYAMLLFKGVFHLKFLEELSMNAFPSIQTVLYDGWVLRFADGYTNRPNSINPIYNSIENVQKKIETCEMIYKGRKLKPTYKITPFVYPENLDALLENKGYEKIHQTSVQTLNLKEIYEPTIQTLNIYNELNEKWFDIKNISRENKITYKKIHSNIIPAKFYISLCIENEPVACGMAVLEQEYVGLFDVYVEESHRNKGFGKQLLLNILNIAKKNGAENAYLQVMTDNLQAVNLYKGLGFEEVYQYWYRVLE